MAKLVLVDNLDRENVADILVEENLSEEEAKRKAEEYNNKNNPCAFGWFAKVVSDDYKLWKGVEELV